MHKQCRGRFLPSPYFGKCCVCTHDTKLCYLKVVLRLKRWASLPERLSRLLLHVNHTSAAWRVCNATAPSAGILYTLYGHHLWDRREEVLHAVGLAKDEEEALP